MPDFRIEVTCPGCEKTFLILASEQGHVADCPHCRGWVDIPEIGRPPSPTEIEEAVKARDDQYFDQMRAENARQLVESKQQNEEYKRQSEQAALHLIEYANQIQQTQLALDRRDQQDSRFDKVLDRLESVIGSWEFVTDRLLRGFERMNTGTVRDNTE